MNILVVGSINVDLVISAPRFPKPGETISGSGFAAHFGGKGANQAIAAAKLGSSVRMLGMVGTDAYGAAAKENLSAGGVDTRAVVQTEGPTGTAVITVCEGENTIVLDAGANGKVTPQLLKEHAAQFAWADAVVLQLEIPMQSVVCASQLAKQYGCTVVLNPAPAQILPQALWENTDMLILNETEAQILTGILPETKAQQEQVLKILQTRGASQVVLTLGAQGSVFLADEPIFWQEAFPTKAVDTTGAGDCFIGALLGALGRGESLRQAARFAAKASAIAVSRPGASQSIPTLAELINE